MLGLLLFVVMGFAFLPRTTAVFEVQSLAPTTLVSGDQFGYFAAASGPLLVVTAPFANNSMGEAFVYTCPTGANSCMQTQVLMAPDAQVNHTFGYSVAVAGNMVYIGAMLADLQGMVYVYNCSDAGECMPTSTITLEDAQPGDWFGYYPFAYESWVLIGSPGRNNESGEAYLYDCSDPALCQLMGTLMAPDGEPLDRFGISTGLEDWLAVVGADNKNEGDGAAYVFNCSDPANCVLLATLMQTEITEGFFGAFLFVSDEIVYVTAAFNWNTTGATWAFNCSSAMAMPGMNSSCALASKLPQPEDLVAGDEFGDFIVAYEGIVVIGAQSHNNKTGIVYVFDCNDATNCTEVTSLSPSDGAPGDNFGWALAITEQMIVSTAPFHQAKTGNFYTFWGNQTATTES